MHASISRRTNKAVARARHRMDWPETNVGAGLPAKRRAGGARSIPQHKSQARNGKVQLFWLSMLVHTSKGVFVY
ncbi:hypothetical protein CHN49_25850 [Pseudomonas putida]|nr:hypothetical protein CHN49_25850 [Pseudomonas putida]